MPFVQINGKLSWVDNQPRAASAQRQLIEQAAHLLASQETDSDYACVPLTPAGEAPVTVCFRREGSNWVFDKME